jgi:ribonucleoside-diphosphate reductase alpha chain
MENEILSLITKKCYQTSAYLADEKGSFPQYKNHFYGKQGFVSTLDEETLDMISKFGIRNSHLTSIAPTGTISLCADNVSSGIEPVFAHKAERTVQEFDGETTVEVWDYGLSELQVHGKTSEEVTIDEHLGVLLTAQRNVDSSVSKTLNVPASTLWEDFKNIYLRAYEGGAKGCTTYKVGGRREGIIKKVEDASCKIDLSTGIRSCDD